MGLSTEELISGMEPREACKYLARIIDSLTRRMDLKDAGQQGAVRPTYEDGSIPRGLYKGRQHADIVRADPHHVMWLVKNGHAAGLGYTEEHIEEAERLVETTPEPVRGRR